MSSVVSPTFMLKLSLNKMLSGTSNRQLFLQELCLSVCHLPKTDTITLIVRQTSQTSLFSHAYDFQIKGLPKVEGLPFWRTVTLLLPLLSVRLELLVALSAV